MNASILSYKMRILFVIGFKIWFEVVDPPRSPMFNIKHNHVPTIVNIEMYKASAHMQNLPHEKSNALYYYTIHLCRQYANVSAQFSEVIHAFHIYLRNVVLEPVINPCSLLYCWLTAGWIAIAWRKNSSQAS